ncbi:MAG: hypothetical protein JXA89_08265 [Anaerolineae bacterium]|nr:hypothetical protein [Anaerolineae bacterium]
MKNLFRETSRSCISDVIREVDETKAFVVSKGENIRVRRIVDRLGFRLVKEIPNARINGDSTVYYALGIDLPQ